MCLVLTLNRSREFYVHSANFKYVFAFTEKSLAEIGSH